MSASRPSPNNAKRPLTNQPSPAAVYTPKSAQAAGTPTPNPADSPERAAKRARFENAQNGSSGVARPSLGQVGRSKSNGRGGAVWVKERVKELEDVYKVGYPLWSRQPTADLLGLRNSCHALSAV